MKNAELEPISLIDMQGKSIPPTDWGPKVPEVVTVRDVPRLTLLRMVGVPEGNMTLTLGQGWYTAIRSGRLWHEDTAPISHKGGFHVVHDYRLCIQAWPGGPK